MTWYHFLTPYIRYRDEFKRAAGLFAGLGHLQPLLLATTNSNYLLDRFCMERCCSSEYISRIVTSLIFMEILATLLVACIGVYTGITYCSTQNSSDAQQLVTHTRKEEEVRDIISVGILWAIMLGYIQILISFLSGGRKGHMHWFYVSLMIQQFVCLLIGGAIGFWEGGVTLWYLMAIPMAPIPVFFYQLMIHSWIRSHGPRYPERLVVEYQIWLALCISILATLFWAVGYSISYFPIELEIKNLNTGNPTSSDAGRITDGAGKAINVTIQATNISGQVTGLSGGVTVTASVALNNCSLTLVAAPANLVTVTESAPNKRFVTLALTGAATGHAMTITLSKSGTATITGTKATLTSKDITLALNTGSPTPLNVYSANVTVDKANNSEVILNIQSIKAEGIITLTSSTSDISSIEITIPVNIKVTGRVATVHTISSVKLTLPATAQSNLQLSPQYRSGNTLTINVQAGAGSAGQGSATVQSVTGRGFYPNKKGYCIYSVRDSEKDIWANIGGKCEYVACYYNKTSDKTQALLILYFRSGGSPEKRYFGTQDAGTATTEWKNIPNEDDFIDCLKTLASSGSLSLNGQNTAQYNRNYNELWLSPVWFPLVMHGMAVGSFGSIFPNLIPKTLVCPKTSRTLTVVSIFLSPLPGIFNVMFADNGWPSAACAWTEWPSLIWQISWLLYLFYGMAFLFAIFNVHSPEWKLCCYIRSHGWMPFMMTLSITLITEILIAIARAGIMMQRPASTTGKDKNHPLLWNKMACLMGLSYLPFWLTTTPMMKSYVSSLDPFLCDKDRDHWPTARYGAWRSGWYWCKCACSGLYTSPRKLITRDMRKALTRKDPKMYFLVTHDIPPEEWLWTLSSIIILMVTLLTHW